MLVMTLSEEKTIVRELEEETSMPGRGMPGREKLLARISVVLADEGPSNTVKKSYPCSVENVLKVMASLVPSGAVRVREQDRESA